MKKNGDKKLIIKNSMFLAIRMAVVMIITLFTTKFILSNLGVEDYGVYNVTLGIVAMCTFLAPSLTNAIQRFYSYELEKNGESGATEVLNCGLVIQILVSLLLIVICETLGLYYVINYLNVPEGREFSALCVFHISVAAIVLSMVQIPFISAVIAHEKMNFYAILSALDTLLKLFIAIGIKYATCDKLILYGFLILLIQALNFVAYVVYASLNFKEVRVRLSFDFTLLKKIIAFTSWNMFETLSRIGKDQGMNLMFNYFYGPILNAARGVANQVVYSFANIVDSTLMASKPQMVQSYAKGDTYTSINMFLTLSKCSVFLVFIMSFPVFVEIDYILDIWLHDSVPQYASLIIRLSIIYTIIDKLAAPVTALIHAVGRIGLYHIVVSVMNIVVLPISFTMFNMGFDIECIYGIMIFATILAQFFYISILNKVITIPKYLYFQEVVVRFLYILPAVLVPLIILYFMEAGLFRFLIFTVVSILSIAGAIYFLGLNNKEKALIESLIRKVVNKTINKYNIGSND